MIIDLHCHSTFSDGILSPSELVSKAESQKIQCLSLTDHDTVDGYNELYQAAAKTGIRIINGIELSTRWKKFDIHILGYQMEHTDELHSLIGQQNNSRLERAKQISSALDGIGVVDAYEKACNIAGHSRVGRPHFAKVLMNEGKIRDMRSAFTQFLGKGKVAYIPTPWLSIDEAVAGIVAAGGKAVIAHPLKYGLTRSKLHELINLFIGAGGQGIEVVSGEMTTSQINEMAATCLRFNLLASSGSDYHGDGISRTGLGRQQQLPLNCVPLWHDWNIR